MRPPTPNRIIRVSANESEYGNLQGELSACRLKIKELEAENGKLKDKLNANSSELVSLANELEFVKKDRSRLMQQVEMFDKQKARFDQISQLADNYAFMKQEILNFTAKLRESNQNWFVRFV